MDSEFLHDRGLDVAGLSHVLHRIRDRSGLPASRARGFDPVAQRDVYAAGRPIVDNRRRLLVAHRVVICDRDGKWSCEVRERLGDAGIDVVQTPARAPNANAHAERFVRSIKAECLDRIIPIGDRHFRRALAEYVAHYHGERNHQGLATP